MTRYAVGDLQGSLTPLKCLLDKVSFDPREDQLWLVGDLINRGPESLATLRYVKNLGNCTRVVLGNHDLHFLAVALNTRNPGKHDTFGDILAASDCDELSAWLLHQPLIYSDPSGDYHMSHAGIPPMWDIPQATAYALEVQNVLQSANAVDFFRQMYGNDPDYWQENLTGYTRLRAITNYFTRMRFCTVDGKLDFDNKQVDHVDSYFAPWFSYPQRLTNANKIIFGHWASLEGKTNMENVYALDTGCAWGGSLTLLNLETEELQHCDCP